MAKTQGTKFKLYVTESGGDKEIAELRTNGVNMASDPIDVSTKTSNNFREYIPGYRSWTMNGDGVVNFGASGSVVSIEALLTYWINQTTVKVKQSTKEGSDPDFVGDAFITNVEITGAHENAIEYTLSLQGTGAITVS